MRVRKAVIPAAGMGKRLYPLTKSTPKELLPIGQRPMICWCIQEAFQSGIEEIGVVVRTGKKRIRNYLTSPSKSNGFGPEEVLRKALKRDALIFIDQPEPRGSGEALYRSRCFVGSEPFAVMMPDFVLFNSRPAMGQIIEALGERETPAVGFLQLNQKMARMFGNVGILETKRVRGPLHRITRLSDKRPGVLDLGKGTQVSKAVGRQILYPDFFDTFEAISWESEKELDDVPVIQRLVQVKEVFGVHLSGCGFDVGNRNGYDAANHFLRSLTDR
jgi:UTP--glucose-1-phosphate uridylyltransferase